MGVSTVEIRNVSPSGAKDLPGYGTVAHRATVRVPDRMGESLCQQAGEWEQVEQRPTDSSKGGNRA